MKQKILQFPAIGYENARIAFLLEILYNEACVENWLLDKIPSLFYSWLVKIEALIYCAYIFLQYDWLIQRSALSPFRWRCAQNACMNKIKKNAVILAKNEFVDF